MKKKLIIFSAIFLSFASCNTGYRVIPITDQTPVSKHNGIIYSLPRTYISVEITITRTDKIKGPYAEFANKFLGLKNVTIANTTTYEITDIQFNTFNEPDPEQFYFIELPHNSLAREKMQIELSEAGLLLSVNGKTDFSGQGNMIVARDEVNIDNSKTFKFIADANVYEKVDTINVPGDTTNLERMILRKTLVEKTPEQRAKDAADFITKIRESRFNIITGFQEVAYERASVEYMYSTLENLENDYLKLFEGYTLTSTLKYRFTYLPESQVYVASVPLFKFSSKYGIVKENHPYGEMVYIHIDRSQNSKLAESYLNRKNQQAPAKRAGIYYRIPEYAKFSIRQGITTKAEATFLVSQFGLVYFLPAEKLKTELYPNTGAIKRVGD